MSNFPSSLTRNITSHSKENLAVHSWLRQKSIILLTVQILATSLIHFLFKRLGAKHTFWAQEWKGKQTWIKYNSKSCLFPKRSCSSIWLSWSYFPSVTRPVLSHQINTVLSKVKIVAQTNKTARAAPWVQNWTKYIWEASRCFQNYTTLSSGLSLRVGHRQILPAIRKSWPLARFCWPSQR